MDEIWKPVVGLEGVYEVSESGRVRRILGGPGKQVGRILTPGFDKNGYLKYGLMHLSVVYNLRGHRIVCEAFNGPAPEGKDMVLHNDGNVANNHYSNLRWGDAFDNQRDAIRHGTHHGSRKTSCLRGHPLDEENTYWDKKGKRSCNICRRAASRKSYYARKESRKEDG